MRKLKIQIQIPDNISVNIEEIAKRYLYEDLLENEELPEVKTKVRTVNIPYELVKEIYQVRGEKVKDFLKKALIKHCEEVNG
ncbi:MAG: hypothetical protein N2053_05170 [Chitinispirillaceae bacterium]|nr:hypothetical protein [Chitinispirillaceae bacterium]